MSKFNTGSDLDIEKTQKAFTVVNGRIGMHGPDDAWGDRVLGAESVQQEVHPGRVRRAAPGHAGHTRGVEAGFYPAATQLYGAFLGEPRTFGMTLRGKLGFSRPAPPPYVAPPRRHRRPGSRAAGAAACRRLRRLRRRRPSAAKRGFSERASLAGPFLKRLRSSGSRAASSRAARKRLDLGAVELPPVRRASDRRRRPRARRRWRYGPNGSGARVVDRRQQARRAARAVARIDLDDGGPASRRARRSRRTARRRTRCSAGAARLPGSGGGSGLVSAASTERTSRLRSRRSA